MKKKFPRDKGGATLLAENMQVDKALIKVAMNIEKKGPELISLICENVLTINEAKHLLIACSGNYFVNFNNKLTDVAETVLKSIRKIPTVTPGAEKIIALWRLKKSICKLARKEAMKG